MVYTCDLHLLKKKNNKRMEANMKKLEDSVRDCKQEGDGENDS